MNRAVSPASSIVVLSMFILQILRCGPMWGLPDFLQGV
jgi:hypothetical protein